MLRELGRRKSPALRIPAFPRDIAIMGMSSVDIGLLADTEDPEQAGA
jgi:hypothetical protein